MGVGMSTMLLELHARQLRDIVNGLVNQPEITEAYLQNVDTLVRHHNTAIIAAATGCIKYYNRSL